MRIRPSAAEDKSLPSNSYLVTLHQEDEHWCDIVMGPSSDIFDAYYDSFGNVVKSMGVDAWHKKSQNYGVSQTKTKSKKKGVRFTIPKDGKAKINVNVDAVTEVAKQYRKLKKYMRSPLYEIKTLDGTETTIKNLVDEFGSTEGLTYNKT